MPTITKLRLEYLNIPIFDQHFDVFDSTFHHIQRQKGGKNMSYHIPYSQNNGARPYMAAQAAARRVPPVPRRNHLQRRSLELIS